MPIEVFHARMLLLMVFPSLVGTTHHGTDHSRALQQGDVKCNCSASCTDRNNSVDLNEDREHVLQHLLCSSRLMLCAAIYY